MRDFFNKIPKLIKKLTMNKFKIFAVFLFLISTSCYAQKLKDKLQGNWVCTNILDQQGNKTIGKFGDSNEFLKFSFEKGELSIVEAPFDRGIKMPIKFGNDNIDLFPSAVIELPERVYKIISVDSNNLVLSTKNKKGEQINYHFQNQNRLLRDPNLNVFDIGQILIKHLKVSKDSKGANRVSEYSISNNRENLYPSPVFDDFASATFGQYVSINFVFPESFPFEKASDELIVDFDVTKGGATNIKVEKGINDEVNSEIIKILEKSSKKWIPLKLDKNPIQSTLRLHFVFYQGVGNFGFKSTK